MRATRAVVVVIALGAMIACGGSGSSPPPRTTLPFRPPPPSSIRLAIWGDTPYSGKEATALPQLVQDINAARVDFTIMVGDLGAAAACEDNTYANVATTFDTFEAPLVYVPGDNEWTDCHGNGLDPLERLARLRQVFFATPESFGMRTITLTAQSPERPEDIRWQHGAVMFVGLNVPGSNNGHIQDVTTPEPDGRRPDQLQAAEAEFQARDAAVRDWLHGSVDAAVEAGAEGLVVAIQADPGFEVAAGDRTLQAVDGFNSFLAALKQEAVRFAKPVVVLHGDSHTYRFDSPLVDLATGEPVRNVSRVETFGSPDVGWVEVVLNPGGRQFVTATSHLVSAGARR